MTDYLLEFDAAATINIRVKRGCSMTITTTFKNDNDEVEDLTGWTARWMVKDQAGGDTWLNLYSGSGITITPAEGSCEIEVTPTQTRGLIGRRGVHDLLMRNSDGSEIICPFDGEIEFSDVISDVPPSS
jgi:hypothetical protein